MRRALIEQHLDHHLGFTDLTNASRKHFLLIRLNGSMKVLQPMLDDLTGKQISVIQRMIDALSIWNSVNWSDAAWCLEELDSLTCSELHLQSKQHLTLSSKVSILSAWRPKAMDENCRRCT